LIPLAIEAALGLRSHVQVYGTDYPTPDGTAIRDYVHVTDLANAHLLALDYLIQGGESRAFNLGTGRGYSVRDVVQAVERATEIKGLSRDAERRAGDPPELVADASTAGEVLRWQQQCSDLKTIVRSALDWHASRLPTTSIPSEDREPVPLGLAE
jgi:UDP-glucose 4-epimerase